MATYKQIAEYVRSNDGIVIKTCWIAHILSDHGKTRSVAPNRIGVARKYPCPPEKRPAIERALKKFAMI
jgi:hypothetical protein